MRITVEFARIHAHLCGDGCVCYYKTIEKDRINRANVVYYNKNVELLKEFRKDMKFVFGVSMSLKEDNVVVKSIRIADELTKFNSYKSREWGILREIKNAAKSIKLEWAKAFFKDEGYVELDGNSLRAKSVNHNGLIEFQELLASVGIRSTVTGPNCDGTWYINVYSFKEQNKILKFSKRPVRNKNGSGESIFAA